MKTDGGLSDGGSYTFRTFSFSMNDTSDRRKTEFSI